MKGYVVTPPVSPPEPAGSGKAVDSAQAAQIAGAPDADTAKPSPRRQRTRRRLVEAAAEVFVAEGVQATSVEAVCTHAGFTRGAFYSNFDSKEQLFLAVLADQYERRAVRLQENSTLLAPLLGSNEAPITLDATTKLIEEYFAPTGEEPAWFALETEFMLLAMRDPSIAPGYVDFMERFRSQLAQLVEPLLAAAGRRFTLPADHAVAVLGGVHERALTITAIAGPDAPEGLGELGWRLAELLFAITEPLPA